MDTISTTDILFATLSAGRKMIESRMLTGIEKMSDIVIRMRPKTRCGTGIYTLNIRNTTKGWSQQRSLTFMA